MIEGRDIICVSPGYWDSPWGTPQQFMNLLSESNQVLYVEPPLSYLHFLRYPERWPKFLAFQRGPVQSKTNLWITTCPPAPPFKRAVEMINLAGQWMVIWWVRRVSRKLGFSNPILWTYSPTAAGLSGKLGEDFLIYHCVDDYAAANPGRRSYIEEQERRLLAKADLVVTCSENILEAKAPWCKEIINVPNGVDFDHYHRAQDEATPVAPPLKKNEAPIIGFCGLLNFRLDEAFLIKAANRYADYKFVFVGPVLKKFPELERLSNVLMLGNQPLADLPSYLKGFDVCLIPYKMNEFVKSISPLKVYEYLAAGKPVVAPDIRAIRDLGDIIFIGQSHEEMLDMIPLALESNSAEAVNARIERARGNTWHHRVDAVSNKISEQYRGDSLAV